MPAAHFCDIITFFTLSHIPVHVFLFSFFFQCLKWFKLWYCRFCARGRPKGLPYIIHYALAHQAAQAVLLWSNSKRALIISLPLGGQLLEQRRQKLKSTPACSDCSEGERGGETERTRGRGKMGASFLAWQNTDSYCRVVLAQGVLDRGKQNLELLCGFSFDLELCGLKEYPQGWLN